MTSPSTRPRARMVTDSTSSRSFPRLVQLSSIVALLGGAACSRNTDTAPSEGAKTVETPVAAATAPVAAAKVDGGPYDPKSDQVCEKLGGHLSYMSKKRCDEVVVPVISTNEGEAFRDCFLAATAKAQSAKCLAVMTGKKVPFLEEKGKGKKRTAPFTTPGKWEFRWSAPDRYFGARLLDGDTGELVDVLATQQGGGDGTTYVPQGGSFSLEIRATGTAWTVSGWALPEA